MSSRLRGDLLGGQRLTRVCIAHCVKDSNRVNCLCHRVLPVQPHPVHLITPCQSSSISPPLFIVIVLQPQTDCFLIATVIQFL